MLEKNFVLKANAADYSPTFAEEHKEAIGFTGWDVDVLIEEQANKCIIAYIAARGTGLTLTVGACRIDAPIGVIPVCYSVPDYHISGFTAATKTDTIHQIAEQIAKYENDDEDCYRVDAVSIGTVVAYLEEELKKGLK